jgi:hypothetical protein
VRAHHEEFINELIDNFGCRKKILRRKNSMTNSSSGPIKASKSFLLCIYDKRPLEAKTLTIKQMLQIRVQKL